MKILLALLLVAAPALALAQAPQKIDPSKSFIRFVSKQMNVPVEGQFKRFQGTVAFDPAKPEATKAEFEVELASIDLGPRKARRKRNARRG
jgi:polyisoprenoid-binding protein YceI